MKKYSYLLLIILFWVGCKKAETSQPGWVAHKLVTTDLSGTQSNEQRNTLARRDGIAIGYGYGLAMMGFALGSRDHSQPDIEAACSTLASMDKLRESLHWVEPDDTFINRLSQMSVLREGCKPKPKPAKPKKEAAPGGDG